MTHRILACVGVIALSVPLDAIAAGPGVKTSSSKEAEKPAGPAEQLAAAKKELIALRKEFTDEHPRVKKQLRKVVELEQQVNAKSK